MYSNVGLTLLPLRGHYPLACCVINLPRLRPYRYCDFIVIIIFIYLLFFAGAVCLTAAIDLPLRRRAHPTNNTQQGIRRHRGTASTELIAATYRMHIKNTTAPRITPVTRQPLTTRECNARYIAITAMSVLFRPVFHPDRFNRGRPFSPLQSLFCGVICSGRLINLFFPRVPKTGTLTKGFDARLANRPSLVLTFGHVILWRSRLNPERQSARNYNDLVTKDRSGTGKDTTPNGSRLYEYPFTVSFCIIYVSLWHHFALFFNFRGKHDPEPPVVLLCQLMFTTLAHRGPNFLSILRLISNCMVQTLF